MCNYYPLTQSFFSVMANYINYFQKSFELRTRLWRIKWGKRLRTEPSVTLKSRLSLTSQETTTKARSWSFLTGSNETWSKERLIQVTTYWLQKSDKYTTTSPFSGFEFCKIIKSTCGRVGSALPSWKVQHIRWERSSLPRGAFQIKRGHRVVIIRFHVSYLREIFSFQTNWVRS